MQTKYCYTVQDNQHLFADDIPSRSIAREELKGIKALAYKDAKIIRQEFVLLAQKQVR